MLDASPSASGSATRLVTREMRADLRKLEDAIPIGFVRVSGGWRYGTDFISRARAIWLTDEGLARVVYGRNVRLKITRNGRLAIGVKDQPS